MIIVILEDSLEQKMLYEFNFSDITPNVAACAKSDQDLCWNSFAMLAVRFSFCMEWPLGFYTQDLKLWNMHSLTQLGTYVSPATCGDIEVFVKLKTPLHLCVQHSRFCTIKL